MRIAGFFACALPLFGAANLTIVPPVILDNDGVTYHATMSQSGLTASGIQSTCWTLHGVSALSTINPSFAINAGTGSGSVVTFTTNEPAFLEDTVTIDIKTAGAGPCNLTGTSGANTPQGQTGIAVTNGSTAHSAGGAFATANCTRGGFPSIGTSDGWPTVPLWYIPGASIDCQVSGATEVDIYGFNNNNTYSLVKDHVSVACPGNCAAQNPTDYNTGISNFVTGSGASTVYSKIVLGTGLSGSHLYQIVLNQANSQAGLIAAFNFIGGTYGAKPSSLAVAQIAGDSESGTGGSGPVDNMQYDLPMLSYHSPIGITTQNLSLAGDTCTQIAASIGTFLSPPAGSGTPLIGIGECGSQNAANGQSIPAFTAEYEIYLCDFMGIAACGDGHLNTAPPTYMFARGMMDLQAGNIGVAYNNAIKAAAAAINSAQGKNIVYYDGSAFILQTPLGCPANDLYTDTYHGCGAANISGTGFGKEANGELPIFNPYINGGSSFSVSGPSTGTTGVPSTVFTSTIAQSSLGAYWGAAGTPTVSSSNAGDTICIVGQSPCGTGSLALASNNLNSTFQFTIQAVSAGARTVTYATNMPLGWTAPSANVYTAANGSPPSFAPSF